MKTQKHKIVSRVVVVAFPIAVIGYNYSVLTIVKPSGGDFN